MTTSPRTPRVLMVEDSADDEELVRLVLNEAGLAPRLMRVSTRAAVEACLTETKWDLILCDHNLPGLDSLTVLRMLTDLGIGTPFVILSGSIADEQAIEAMRCGARDFIHKDALGKLVPVIKRELATADMTEELDRLTRHIQRMSDFDRLTGLPNRDKLLQYLAQRVRKGHAGDESFSLLLLDVGRFRQISRNLGPIQGNQVIVEVARRISHQAGPVNFVARVGGDSFAMIVLGVDGETELQTLMQTVTAQVGQVMHIGPYELFITLNIGACPFSERTPRAETIFANAEIALYQAKQAGGNSYRLFHPSMAGSGTREIVIEGALHNALKCRQFVLHYQPQIALASARPVSVEALLRWQHPEWGLVSPGEFIPLLEETGLIIPVGEWIIDAACAQLHHWDGSGFPGLRMAVNLSALQFGDPRLIDVVASALHRHRIEAGRLELEITESIVMQAKDEAIAALRALRQLGVRIAVDDFGTGYSSLGYLKHFPITTLKIDQMFVRGCDDSLHDQALVDAMIQMGQRLNLEIVAEGVETKQQADFLSARGCELAQGYLFGRPLPAGDLAEQWRRLPGAQGNGHAGKCGHQVFLASQQSS